MKCREQSIYDAFRKLGVATVAEIRELTGFTKSTLTTYISRMHIDGILRRVRCGTYELTGVIMPDVEPKKRRSPEQPEHDAIVTAAARMYGRLNGSPLPVYIVGVELRTRRTCIEAQLVGEFTQAVPLDEFVRACKIASYRVTRGVGKPRCVGTDLKGVSV